MMLTEETPVPVNTTKPGIDWPRLFLMLRQSPLTLIGGVIMLVMLLLMVTSPWIVPHDPNALDLTARLQAPSAQHWFGTDEVGRDLFSRVLVGSQQSITAGLAVVVIAGSIGSLLGCLSGVLGGRGDAIIMRVMDIMLSIPSLVLTMALAAALGRVCLTPCWRLRLCVSRFTFAWRAGKPWWCASLPMCRPRAHLAHRAGI